MMVNFEHPAYLFMLLIAPLLIAIGVLVKKNRPVTVYGTSPGGWKHTGGVKFILLVLSFSLLVIGLANPQLAVKNQSMPLAANTKIVFVVDVSKSMLCADVLPYRLALAQQFMQSVLNKLKGQKVGVVVFAGKAQPYIPLTDDYAYVKSAIQSFANIIPQQGTSLRDALKIAQLALGTQKGSANVICVLSDGESHRLNFGGLSDTIRKSGIRIFAVGTGTTAGSPVMGENGKGVVLAKQNPISRLHPENLLRITGGNANSYLQLADKDIGAAMFVKQMATNQQVISGLEVVKKDYYQFFLLMALLVLVAELFIS